MVGNISFSNYIYRQQEPEKTRSLTRVDNPGQHYSPLVWEQPRTWQLICVKRLGRSASSEIGVK